MYKQSRYAALVTGRFQRFTVTHTGQTSDGRMVDFGHITYYERETDQTPVTEDIRVYRPYQIGF